MLYHFIVRDADARFHVFIGSADVNRCADLEFLCFFCCLMND